MEIEVTPLDRVRGEIERTTGHPGQYHGGQWQERCPAHQDRNPSLSVTETAEGHVLLHCHAGCSVDAILAAIGLARKDLYPIRKGDRRQDPVVSTYRYVDEAGELLYEVERTVTKKFRQRRPDPNKPGAWTYSLDRTRRVLYRLPHVIAAVKNGQTVYLVEGEKDVHSAEKLGHTATCNPGGAGKWRPEYTPFLAGADVVIIADNDNPGLAHARQVAAALKPVAASVTVGVPTIGKDLTDLLAAGFGVDDLTLVDLNPATTPDKPDDSQDEAVGGVLTKIRVTPLTAFKIGATRWTWATPATHSGWLAQGELTLIAGREGIGKSTFLAWIAARITRGDLPGIHEGEPKSILYAASEDSFANTIAPRMVAAGADLSRIFRIDAVEDDMARGLSLPRDSHDIPRVAREYDAAVLMCDPILSLVDGRINPNHSKELRAALEPLRAQAETAGLAIAALAHFNKTRDIDGLSMVAGSRAWVEVARTAMLLAWDEELGRVVVSQAKNNLGRKQDSHLTYTIADTVVESDDGDIHIGRVLWGDDSEIDAATILQRKPDPAGRDNPQGNQQTIIEYLQTQEVARSPREVADALTMDRAVVKTTLNRLAARGIIRKIGTGLYAQNEDGQ